MNFITTKFLKKRAAALILGSVFALGASNVYASAVLDTNLVSLIKTGIQNLGGYYEGEAVKSTNELETKYKQQISQYVDVKSDTVIKELEAHKNAEVAKANTALDNEYKALTQAVDSEVKVQLDTAKTNLTNKVTSEVEQAKKDLSKELERKINEKLKR